MEKQGNDDKKEADEDVENIRLQKLLNAKDNNQ